MEDVTLSPAEFEHAMESLFCSFETESIPPKPLDENSFDKISRLLRQAGKRQWSQRPRMYTVLRLINELGTLEAFVEEGLKDIAFPYTQIRLPTALSPKARAEFLNKQSLVITKAADLEIVGRRHRHLDHDADEHFHWLGRLGSGAYGEVDHVRSKLSLEEYARKRLHRKMTFSKDQKAMKIFENELENLKRLSHHHLVKFVGSYSDPKYIGLIIAPVADCNLKEYLEQDSFSKREFPLLRTFFGCLCSAVMYLHDNQCRHKDLKPENFLLHKSKILITDFGTAHDSTGSLGSTTVGQPKAYSPNYAAPEVVDHEPRNSSSDIWSLGCVFLDMLTVLKGSTLYSKASFFESTDTGRSNPRTNPQALQLWLLTLTSKFDNQPIEWIKMMIKEAPRARVTAAHLFDQIQQYEDDHVYYSSCCGAPDDEDESAYQGSDTFNSFDATDDFCGLPDSETHGEASAMLGASDSNNSHRLSRNRRKSLEMLSSAETSKHKNKDWPFWSLRARNCLRKSGFDVDSGSINVTKAMLWACGLPLSDSRLTHGYKTKEDVVRLLIQEGADVTAANSEGNTALHLLGIRGITADEQGTLKLLLGAGANINASNDHGRTLLHLAVGSSLHTASIVQLLLDEGAQVEKKDMFEATPLHVASQGFHLAADLLVELLIESGARINDKDCRGDTPLHIATARGCEPAANRLIAMGADINSLNKSRVSPLQYAAGSENEETLRLLLGMGANVSAPGWEGWTALHIAAASGSEELTRILIEHGAITTTKTHRGETALDLAQTYKHEKVVILLRSATFTSHVQKTFDRLYL